MPIKTEPRYFGEGIHSYGSATPEDALNAHRHHVRVQRLNDLLGKDNKMDSSDISNAFEEIAAAIKAGDDQVSADNADFLKQHKLKVKG